MFRRRRPLPDRLMEELEFINAWEATGGPALYRQPDSEPPEAVFRAWLTEHDRSGIAAETWLRATFGE